MLFKQVAAIAAFSVITEAFLIPPQISKADIEIVKALPFELKERASRIVNLECTGCPVPAGNVNGISVNLEHVTSTLELNYTIEQHTNDVDRLLLNGVSIYPPNFASIEPFKASQKFSKDQPFETQENVRLGYEMSVAPVKKDAANRELIAINIHIFEVGNRFINGIDTVELYLVKTSKDKLLIIGCEKKPSTSTIGFIAEDAKDCTSLLCKWRAIIAAKLAHIKPFKGCGKGKGNKAGAISSHNGQGKSHGGRPHHKGQHHGGHRHHRQHGFARVMRILRSISIHVLIPIFIGIAAGLTASVVGMVIGHLVVLVWRTIRGGSPAYSRVALDDVLDEENKVLIIEPQGPPPVYEDVVIIEEVSEEKGEDKA